MVSESFDVWVEALDRFVEDLEGNGPGIFGDTLISLDLSVPGGIASAWMNAPEKTPRNYALMSIRIQEALKELIPFYYFQDPRKYADLDAAAPLLVYSAIPPIAGMKVNGDKVDLNTGDSVYWAWTSQKRRRLMARLPNTKVNLDRAIRQAFDTLSSRPEPKLNKKREFYKGNLARRRIVDTALQDDLRLRSDGYLLDSGIGK